MWLAERRLLFLSAYRSSKRRKLAKNKRLSILQIPPFPYQEYRNFKATEEEYKSAINSYRSQLPDELKQESVESIRAELKKIKYAEHEEQVDDKAHQLM
jgi:hypothetical protein